MTSEEYWAKYPMTALERRREELMLAGVKAPDMTNKEIEENIDVILGIAKVDE